MKPLEGLNEEIINAIEKSRRRVIDSIGNNMDLYGVTQSVGYLYGNMYFHDGPVTLDEMGQQMGMSKTSMSTGMRALIDLEMINKVWGKGSRKDLYEVVPDWHQNFVDFFSIKWRKSVEMNMNAIQKSLRELQALQAQHPGNEQLAAVVQRDTEKLEQAIDYYQWLGRLIDALESGEIYNWVPKENGRVDKQ